MNIGVLISGRSKVSNMDAAVQHLTALRDSLSPATVVFFLSLNADITDHEYLATFCSRLCIDVSQCVAVLPPSVPSEIYQFPRDYFANYDNCWSMFRHNENAFKLLEAYERANSTRFDVAIKYRVDITSDVPLPLPTPVEPATIYIPSGSDHGGINDQIALGTRDAIGLYCQCVNCIIHFCRYGCIYHPETLLRWHLHHQPVKVVRFDFAYQFSR